MELTLVSHYGAKPPHFAALIFELQGQLVTALGVAFAPYALDQVHGTIVGLEGCRTSAGIINANFRQYRNEERIVDLEQLLRNTRAMEPFAVRVGGFQAHHDFRFTSNGAHPHLRSFSIQGEIAVAMGWPWAQGRCSPALVNFRKSLERCGVLHKWHRREEDQDNDFFFVVGRVDVAAMSQEQVTRAEDLVRRRIGERVPIELDVSGDSLLFVAYEDAQLPLSTSRVWSAGNPQLDAETLASVYQ